jgi:hypothetical protein
VRACYAALAQQLVHPLSLYSALYWDAMLHHLRQEASLTHARAEAAMTIATDQEFPQVAQAIPRRGWALIARRHWEGGIAQLHQGLVACGVTRDRPYYLALLAEASAKVHAMPRSCALCWQATRGPELDGVRWLLYSCGVRGQGLILLRPPSLPS